MATIIDLQRDSFYLAVGDNNFASPAPLYSDNNDDQYYIVAANLRANW